MFVLGLPNGGHQWAHGPCDPLNVLIRNHLVIIRFFLPKLQRMLLHPEKIQGICLAYHKVAHHKLNNFQLIL
jgi:hypothetical protein